MTKKIFLLVTLIITSYCRSQEFYDIENRKGKVFFTVATDYRLNPISGAEDQFGPTLLSAVDINEQNAGAALSYGLDWYVTKNLSLSISNSLRYDSVFAGNIDAFNGDLDLIEAVPSRNGLLLDFHGYFQYHIKLFKNSEIILQAGASLLNVGSDVRVLNRFIPDDTGEVVEIEASSDNTSYIAANLGVGWKKKKLTFLAGAFTSNNTAYFNSNVNFTLLYFKISYTIFRL